MGLVFDAADHTYRLNGKVIPSVTRIISSVIMNPFVGVSRDVLDAAGLRGTYVHDACQMYDEGDLDIAALDPALQPYVQAWIRFREESGFTPKLIESVVHDPVRGFCGRLDRTGMMGASFSRVILDVKTGEVYPTTGIQLAAYLSCLQAETGTKRIAVKLNDNGTYQITEYKSKDDLAVFYHALSIYQWRTANGAI